MRSLAKDLGIISLAAVAFSFGGCSKQADGTSVESDEVKQAALHTNIVSSPIRLVNNEKQEIWQVPANPWPNWLKEYMNKEENIGRKVASMEISGEAQSAPISNANVVLTTSFVIVIDK